MSPETAQLLTLALSALNVLILPAVVGVGRWAFGVETRLARIEARLQVDAP